jgi:membrane protease subunit HflK
VIGVIAIASTLATSVHIAGPGEAVVVRRWGRVLERPWTQGAHWGWPFGIDRVARVRTDAVRQISIGLPAFAGPQDRPGAGELLTADWNLVQAHAEIQYRVAEPIAYLLTARDRDRLLRPLAESSLSRALAARRIDEILQSARAEVARTTAVDLGNRAQRLHLGVRILAVHLTDVRPPVEVQADFAAAQSARSDSDRRTGESKTYAATTLAAARATARSQVERARAEAYRAEALARARADRFRTLLVETGRNRRLTIQRLYFDAMRELLPRVKRKVTLAQDDAVDVSVFGAGDREAK